MACSTPLRLNWDADSSRRYSNCPIQPQARAGPTAQASAHAAQAACVLAYSATLPLPVAGSAHVWPQYMLKLRSRWLAKLAPGSSSHTPGQGPLPKQAHLQCKLHACLLVRGALLWPAAGHADKWSAAQLTSACQSDANSFMCSNSAAPAIGKSRVLCSSSPSAAQAAWVLA